jgi:hypothetical protein
MHCHSSNKKVSYLIPTSPLLFPSFTLIFSSFPTCPIVAIASAGTSLISPDGILSVHTYQKDQYPEQQLLDLLTFQGRSHTNLTLKQCNNSTKEYHLNPHCIYWKNISNTLETTLLPTFIPREQFILFHHQHTVKVLNVHFCLGQNTNLTP